MQMFWCGASDCMQTKTCSQLQCPIIIALLWFRAFAASPQATFKPFYFGNVPQPSSHMTSLALPLRRVGAKTKIANENKSRPDKAMSALFFLINFFRCAPTVVCKFMNGIFVEAVETYTITANSINISATMKFWRKLHMCNLSQWASFRNRPAQAFRNRIFRVFSLRSALSYQIT